MYCNEIILYLIKNYFLVKYSRYILLHFIFIILHFTFQKNHSFEYQSFKLYPSPC